MFGQPDWDFRSFQLERDLALARQSHVGKAVFGENPDLAAFKASGGKLLHYHGWNDPGIPARASINYYDSVASHMGGAEALQPGRRRPAPVVRVSFRRALRRQGRSPRRDQLHLCAEAVNAGYRYRLQFAVNTSAAGTRGEMAGPRT